MSNSKNSFHITKDTKGKLLSKIKICAIYPIEQNDKIIEKINLVNEYCFENSINFTKRVFDSYNYTDDRDYISRLPAYHIYRKYDIIETVYTKAEIISTIENYISRKKEKERIRKERKREFKENHKLILDMIIPDFSFLNYFSRKSN